MADIVGVVFRGGIKVYHFDPAGLELERGDRVVVQTCSGPEIGQVVEPTRTVDDSELPAPLKKVVRVATDKDLESQAEAEGLRRQAMDTCRELIAEHGLDMKLVGADIGFGGEKITFSFTSEDRVDFRTLVADLAKALKMRIELRQVGAREEARMVGGLGPCGRGLCCTLFQGDDDPVSIRMAKEQNLPLNPMKISGLCGRLMCCLKYEQEQYVRFRKEAPAKGTPVSTPVGEGVVVGYNVTKESIIVRFEDGSNTEVRLSTCEEQEGGGLLVIPEVPVEVPAPVSWLDSPFGIERLEAAERSGAALPVVEAQVVLGENGEPVDVVVAEGSRRGRGRRGRGRRRGGNRGEGEYSGEGAAAAPAAGERSRQRPGSGAGAGSGESRGGGQAGGSGQGAKRDHRSPQRSDRHHKGEGAPAGEGAGGERTGSGEGGGEQTGSGTSSTSRRRRRPRRPGGGGGGESGGTGAGGGGNVGGSGGSGGSGE